MKPQQEDPSGGPRQRADIGHGGLSDCRTKERQLVDLAEQERQRIGRELHDCLGQQISAVGTLAISLQHTLQQQSSSQLQRMAQLVRGIEQAKEQVRLLARGLLPVEVDVADLANSLRELAGSSTEMFGTACLFDCQQVVCVEDKATATHLYRIAQESITNAMRHANAEQVTVSLREREKGEITLEVCDDGVGLPTDPFTAAGSGLRIMRCRAGLIGATLSLAASESGGTVVTCTLPAERASQREATQ